MEIKVDKIVYICIFFWLFLSVLTTTFGVETDIACLKSIKASLEDPYGYLSSSWDFNNNTEGFICRFAGVKCWHPDENRVLILKLNDMGLKGQFPIGIKNCTSLAGLDLSNNQIQGPIPFEIHKILSFVTSLDLSCNNFSGEIPLSIANCSYLNVLKLDHNRLTGQIPQQISSLKRLKTFSIANNLLSGPVPKFENAKFTADSFANNNGLCGAPLETCEENEDKFGYSFKTGFAIGFVVSVVVYASYFVPWLSTEKSNKKKKITIATMVMSMMRKKKDKKPETDQLGGLSTMDFMLVQEEISVPGISFTDLCNATANFCKQNIIWEGKIGTVYKATLQNGYRIAVKKFYNSQDSEEQFISELKILNKLRNESVLPLLGFCKESNKRFLVYKYVVNGNLFDWLHSVDDKKKTLQWPLRMKIAVGLAKGLAWLHHGSDFRVAHLKINSKCVLLDQNFEPKLSNFGMATVITPKEINSSRGFVMDIEFWEECFLKEDVFNFGIVLLELITGKNATSLNNSDGSLDKWINNLSNVSSSSSSFCPYDAVDNILIGQGHDDEIFQCLRIACNCVQSLSEQRPTMLAVYKTICTFGATSSERSLQTEIVASNSIDEFVDTEITEMH